MQGRPKHIYSIVKKMRGKSLDFDQVLDVRALRVIVPDVKDCYAALAWVHARFSPIIEEFDDYIARPKPNGYQSLHTIVRDAAGRPDRDPDPHPGDARARGARRGGALGLQGGRAQGLCGRQRLDGVRHQDRRAAPAARLGARPVRLVQGLFEDRIYVLTPQASIVELPRVPRRWTSPTPCTRTWATAAAARASTA